MAELARIFTTVVTASTFAIPDGATEIFIKNSGAGAITWSGDFDVPVAGAKVVSSAITLASGESFSYGYVGRGRKGFTIDATASVAQVSLTF